MVPITGRARSFLLVFKNKIERRGRQNKSNRPINLLNGIKHSGPYAGFELRNIARARRGGEGAGSGHYG